MLRVTVELYPHGLAQGKKTLAQIEITNTETGGTVEYGDYEIREVNQVFRGAVVTKHARLTENVWSLVRKAIAALGY